VFFLLLAFVEIDCGDKKRVVKSKATDSPQASNPNYLEVLEIEVDLVFSNVDKDTHTHNFLIV
jgi:hypothetical protein